MELRQMKNLFILNQRALSKQPQCNSIPHQKGKLSCTCALIIHARTDVAIGDFHVKRKKKIRKRKST